MPTLKSYEDALTIKLMQATPYPREMAALAISITMNTKPEQEAKEFTESKGKFIIDAEHMSVLEHVFYTFYITGISRSFLAQITRQRMASPTSGSQHYQNYEDYDCIVHKDLVHNATTQVSLNESFRDYSSLTSQGIMHQEARQVLPNAAAVNYLWTINAHSLLWFLKKRLCYRNVAEMQNFAEKLRHILVDHFPEVFLNVGPQCFMDNCKQGFLQCDHGKWFPAPGEI